MTAPPGVPETWAYTLTLNGRYAGTQDWLVRPDKGTLVARVQTDFGGTLPAGRRVQESRIQPETGFSLAYAEAEGSSRKPQFETVFDERSGLVTLRQGKDEAREPLLEGHHDPLSLLLWLRRLPQVGQQEGEPPEGEHPGTRLAEYPEPRLVTVRMVGGRVHLQPLPGGEVLGLRARVYFLRPGGAYAYIEAAAPHRILRLIQPSDFGPVEALIILEQAAGAREQQRSGGHNAAVRPVRGQVGKPRRRGK
ncbi:hypothetical protein [Deinococcus sp.]|uniref:hypothetical protein n=1 Tax=Deinococcus sp. TaxID=47478 RepID=UPI003C7E81E5